MGHKMAADEDRRATRRRMMTKRIKASNRSILFQFVEGARLFREGKTLHRQGRLSFFRLSTNISLQKWLNSTFLKYQLILSDSDVFLSSEMSSAVVDLLIFLKLTSVFILYVNCINYYGNTRPFVFIKHFK